jgi:hypothetical protein
MRIQSAHALADRRPIADAPEALDPYMTDPVAVRALIGIEQGRVPEPIWEYCAGTGNIVLTLRDAGYEVAASDIYDYGLPGCKIEDYRAAVPPLGARAIITNPPFALAFEFLQKSLREVPYVAYLLRTNFLESVSRKPFFDRCPPARVHIASRRLPTMHHHGWTGPKAASNTCHAWFVWDEATPLSERGRFDWFDWKDFVEEEKSAA